MLLEQIADCEELSMFLTSQKWTTFFLGKDYLEFVDKYPKRIIALNKKFWLFKSKGTVFFVESESCYGHTNRIRIRPFLHIVLSHC